MFNSANLWQSDGTNVKTSNTYAYVDLAFGNWNCDLLSWWSQTTVESEPLGDVIALKLNTTDLEFQFQDSDVVEVLNHNV